MCDQWGRVPLGSWLVGLCPFLATSPSAPNCGQLGGPFGLVWGLEAELQAVPATVNYCIVKFNLTWLTMRSKYSLAAAPGSITFKVVCV